VSEEIRKYTYLALGKENQVEIEGSESCASGLRADNKTGPGIAFSFSQNLQFYGKIMVGSSVDLRRKR
jgi:hypothetical protein